MQLQTIQRPEFQSLSVGQQDKTAFLTTKPTPYMEKPVGRQSNQNPRTHPHAHEEFAMKYLSDLLESLEVQSDVVFHNLNYPREIHAAYGNSEATIFLQWVKAFALMRRSHRPQPIAGVVKTTDNDFLSALSVMQQRKIQRFNIHPNFIQWVVNFISEYYQGEAFTAKALATDLDIHRTLIDKVIIVLQLQKTIRLYKVFGNANYYTLTKYNSL